MLRDLKTLWRVDLFTDPEAGDLMRYVPVTAEGVQDPFRLPYFMGKVTITVPRTRMPPVNLSFRLEGVDLPTALASWPAALKAAVEAFDSDRRRAQLLAGVGRQN